MEGAKETLHTGKARIVDVAVAWSRALSVRGRITPGCYNLVDSGQSRSG
jgi:hypothetical protein